MKPFPLIISNPKGIKITEDFRAIGLERILYRCPNCQTEGEMLGDGITLKCNACQKEYVLEENGEMKAKTGETEFSHIPNWYTYQRGCVKKEIESGDYKIEAEVSIGMMVDFKAIYMVGEGVLTHTAEGFILKGCEGKLHYTQKPQSSYGLYADYFWYEIGDVICIGDADALYYCFPKKKIPVAKARLAAEEMYKLYLENRKRNKKTD